MKIHFEWDAAKAASNLAKHKVSFELATHVFADPQALTQQDRIEGYELRWQTVGMVEGQLILLVAHLVGEDADGAEVIRIISARKADRKERTKYEKNH